MICEKIVFNEEKDVYLLRYTFEKYPDQMSNVLKRPAVVIFPGGGYINFCQREADPVAFQFMAAGYNAFILKYSLGADAVYPNPLLDLCQAMKMIRENAEEWGIIEDQIAVCGFSAGGHLAASLGVYWNDPEIMERSGCLNGENKPNALILGYPVISTSWLENNGTHLARVIGDNDWDSTYKKLNLHTGVGKHTPPAFIFHTGRDKGVPPKDSIYFATALLDAGVPYELHIFPNGGHGLSLGTPQVCPPDRVPSGDDKSFAQWVNLCVNWLDRLFQNPEEGYAPLPKDPYSSKY